MLAPLPLFTLIHVGLSLLGIVAGLVVVGGFLAGVHFSRWIAVFLLTTVLTNVTGFGFPFTTLLPSHIVGGLSLVVLAVAIAALYGLRLAGVWQRVFVLASVLALYLNVFVLVAQLLQKVPVLAALAPDPKAPAFAITQGLALVLFAGLAWAAAKAYVGGGLAGGRPMAA